MRKIITISAAVVGAFVVLGIGFAAASSGGATPPPTASQPTVPVPGAPASAAPVDIQSKCKDIITTGEAKHVAMVTDRDASKKRDDALDAMIADSNYGTPEHDALSTASDEATAAQSITYANLETARANFRAASSAAIGTACSTFNDIDLQFLNADMALSTATPTTQASADLLWTNAQTAWDAAKVAA